MSGLRLAYYGDDFSGTTDVMEVIAQAGLSTRVFLDPPSAQDVVGLETVGVAGISRSLPTSEMDALLRPTFRQLKALGPTLLHYKVCSTFDSSPDIGSIGKAIDVGAEVTGKSWVPVIVGAPALGRFVAFGNLFARSGQDSPVYRLDRHPTMSRHPITPMRESDLRLILQEQTQRRVELIDAVALDAGTVSVHGDPAQAPAVVFDTTGDRHLAPIGEAVWQAATAGPTLFAVGSSGLEYALVAHWRAKWEVPSPITFRVDPVETIVAVSGSCSPVTARQIEWAIANGFGEVAVSPEEWVGDAPRVDRSVRAVLDHLSARRSVIVHSSRGPDDPRMQTAHEAVRDSGPRLGRFLGEVLNRVLAQSTITRLCAAGGDTSSYVARSVGIHSLELAAPISPGSPLCRIRAPGSAVDGREMIFKGGQVGKADFFELVRAGRRQA